MNYFTTSVLVVTFWNFYLGSNKERGTLQEKRGRATSFFPPTVVVRGTTLNDKTSSDVAYIMLDFLEASLLGNTQCYHTQRHESAAAQVTPVGEVALSIPSGTKREVVMISSTSVPLLVE
uniref:Cytochrome c biogenesis protein CcmFC protein n=1 Tax=Tanacetum cinerariifolium TaxID=118510 RepID=A0A699UJP8_TANCI|nr:cytochrome c biogenesis protein CcmFC protein [Tanacetum cinerariifolium]